MKIRSILTLQFALIVTVIFIAASVAIYLTSSGHRREDFYDRLKSKATNTAKLLIEVEAVDLKLLKIIEKDNPVSLPNERISIFNYLNDTIYSTDAAEVLNTGKEMLNRIRLEREVKLRQGDYEVLGFLFTDKFDRFVVVIAATDIFGFRKLKNLRIALFSVFGASILLVLISGWFYAGRALRPISRVIEQVNAIGISSLNLRVDEGNGNDEIAKLAQTFNRMLVRLETAFRVQKNFIANASHELRTPLTAITGQAEVVLMKDRSVSEYKEALYSVLEDMKSLNSTSNRLLLLAQASSETSEVSFGRVRMDDILWQARTELLRRHKEYSIEIIFDDSFNDELLEVMGNEQLMKTAVLNLMENGCKYSTPNEIRVTLGMIGKSIFIRFEDKGIGIPAEDMEHIFEPFHRSINALSVKGHGIGLSLVDRILRLHKGIIRVESEVNRGTVFTVTIPVT
ncbi:MAG: HAMP domain-containing protein [Bacteroidetes bacterium]|nr:HAMP domain-containing protein [Bacteroidota bacterium]